MIIQNYLVKFIKKTHSTINRLIKKKLNKLNSANFFKISRSNKFILPFAVLFVLFISYLSIPNVYDKTEISIKLNNQLQKKLNLNFNLSENFKYNFLPRPHFIYKNTSISNNQNEISKIEELKIFISLKLSSLFSKASSIEVVVVKKK